MSQFIANIHNAWLQLDPGVRAALSFSAAVLLAAAIGLVQGFGWVTYAVPVLAVLVAQLVRSKIAPAFVAWFMSTFGYAPAYKVQTPSAGGLRRSDIWVRA